MFVLVYRRHGSEHMHRLAPGDTFVGRASTCQLVIDEPGISRVHARVRVEAAHCTVSDLGSRNGTFVNGARVVDAELAPGDDLVFGTFAATVGCQPSDGVILSESHVLLEPVGTMSRPVGRGDLGAGRGDAEGAALLRMVSELASALVARIALPDVLDRIVGVAFDHIPCERSFLLLADNLTGELTIPVARDRAGSAIVGSSLSTTVVKRVMTERVALLAADAAADPTLQRADSVQAAQVRSFMCAPLWHEDRVVGVVYVDNPQTQQFSAADLDLLVSLGQYAAVAIERARVAEVLEAERRRRERLQRYHSPGVLERILRLEDPDEELCAQERDVTVLIADIVGFTRVSECMAPTMVAHLLNLFFGRVVDVIFAHEGTLDKFLGDGVLVVFGAPFDTPDHPLRGVRAARGIQAAMAELNDTWPYPRLQLRIALHSGVVTAGEVGAPMRREYTVLGDVVNTCARLAAEVCPAGEILASRDTYERVRDTIGTRPIRAVQLRGRSARVEVVQIEPAGEATLPGARLPTL